MPNPQNRPKRAAGLLCLLLTATFALAFAGGCKKEDPARLINGLANEIALVALGNDATTANTLFASPETAIGYKPSAAPQWHAYAPVTQSDIEQYRTLLQRWTKRLGKIPAAKLCANDAATYDSVELFLASQSRYYDSPHALTFALLGGDCIDSAGGYVADFASAFENYAFRREQDVADLLSLTRSTLSVFPTYADFAADRIAANMPLYDTALANMQDYLADILRDGRNYYLYTFAECKIRNADCLTDAQKQTYAAAYRDALTENFTEGVRRLHDALTQYKGQVESIEKSYTAVCGDAGKAYYEWLFYDKTGLTVNLDDVYSQSYDAWEEASKKSNEILATALAWETDDPQAYSDFLAYANDEKYPLGLNDPEDMLDFCRQAAQDIAPALQHEPTIDFKYMDATIADRTTLMAYYILSPVDQTDAPEHITLNGEGISPSSALTTIAHEGYPGHLYAHVKAKESGLHFFNVILGCASYSEGWAKYVETALWRAVAARTDDAALRLYAEYATYSTLARYLSAFLEDMAINYCGDTVDAFVANGTEEEIARERISYYAEIPALYVPYGYGFLAMYEWHEQAKAALGNAYSETDFNAALLARGDKQSLLWGKNETARYIAAHTA